MLFSAIYYEPKPELLSKAKDVLSNFIRSGINPFIAYSLPYKLYAHEIAKILNAPIAPGPHNWLLHTISNTEHDPIHRLWVLLPINV